jgi:hypothetical protein
LALTVVSIAADDPKAMALSGVMGLFPLGRNHRSVANLDNQIAHSKSRLFCIRMKSQWGHLDLWLFTMSVIFASNNPFGFSTRLACFKNGGYR